MMLPNTGAVQWQALRELRKSKQSLAGLLWKRERAIFGQLLNPAASDVGAE